MKGEKYIVETESPVLIGRNQRAAINISNDPSVSRKHALIYWRDRDCYIKDLQSTNGTYIEGRKTDRETCLCDGTIQLRTAASINNFSCSGHNLKA